MSYPDKIADGRQASAPATTAPLDLAMRYGEERLPRYTSYPTAPHFSDAISSRTYGDWLATLPKESIASIYLHIPFCRSMCWYCGCNTTVSRRPEPVAAYLEMLRQEIGMVANRIPGPLSVGHVHLGGGTPTIMTPLQFEELVELLRRRFVIDRNAEIAIEIDPRTVSAAMIRSLGASGVTRASLGVQSFDPAVQQAINRRQSFEETAAATHDLRAAGIGGISFDLIYGLPHQTVTSCLDTVRQCVELRPDRFSVFGYAHVPSFKKHQRKIGEAFLPDSRERLRQVSAIAEALVQAGYRQIGMDHFALPNDQMAQMHRAGTLRRNFQGYTTDASDTLIGFGASAIGKLAQGFVQNEPTIPGYCDRIRGGELATARGYALTADDRLRADIIERLMCDMKVDLTAVCDRHGAKSETLLRSASRLRALADDGIVELDGSLIRIADDAHYLVRSVASTFDSYLATKPRSHSRAV